MIVLLSSSSSKQFKDRSSAATWTGHCLLIRVDDHARSGIPPVARCFVTSILYCDQGLWCLAACPSRYGMDQLVEDGHRLVYFSHQRDNKIILSDKENAEEAHRRARMDCFNAGPESAARHRLAIFKDKKRRFGNSTGSCLTWKEQVDLRLLELLYPQRKPYISGPDDELYYHPFRIEPLAADGNLYPRNSELSGLQ